MNDEQRTLELRISQIELAITQLAKMTGFESALAEKMQDMRGLMDSNNAEAALPEAAFSLLAFLTKSLARADQPTDSRCS